jgi:hypothetical protein
MKKFLLLLTVTLFLSTPTINGSENDGNHPAKHKTSVLSTVSYPFKTIWNHKKKIALMIVGFVVFRVYKQQQKFNKEYADFNQKIRIYHDTLDKDTLSAAQALIDNYFSWFVGPIQKQKICELVSSHRKYFPGVTLSGVIGEKKQSLKFN